MPAKTCAASEIEYELYEPYRRLLAPRPAPPPVAVDKALAEWHTINDEVRFKRWLKGGRQPSAEPPVLGPTPDARYGGTRYAGTAGTVVGRFWVDRFVINCRFRDHVAAVRKAATSVAHTARPFLPGPAPEKNDSALAFTARTYKHFESKGSLAEYGPTEPGKAGVIAWGKRRYDRWIRIMNEVDVACPYDWRHGPCALAACWPVGRHNAFWRLLSSELPVVISATTGRLIDGLRRLEAHRAAGDRSPGVRVEYREYPIEDAERRDVITLNAKTPGLPKPAKAALADQLRAEWREEAASNSGRSRYEEPKHSTQLPAHGRRGAPLRQRRPPVRVNDRLAAAAGMSTSTFKKYRPRGPKPQDPAAAP